ncbi:MAG: hypothetical protein VXY90_13790, partial [Pseudomonadota bacterium]|nr:hypothetical protein [Pseudomonadota bacterium]
LIQVRVRPTVRTRAQMGASGSFAGGFVDALRELCGKVDGIEFSGFFVSMAGGEGVAMLTGSPLGQWPRLWPRIFGRPTRTK